MARQHLHLPSVEEPCAYLEGLASHTEFRVLAGVTPWENERLLELGWRHFGAQYFRPVCASCMECVSLRIPVDTFRPSKSQRRAWRKCADLRVKMGAPVADAERLEIFRAWHAMREESRGWKQTDMTLEDYRTSFCEPHECTKELAYYDGGRLVAIGIVDVTPRAMSSVYFYYDPGCRHRALGVASVLFEIEWARRNGRSHLYLGYRVRGCPSTAYKARYGPHELLVGRPGLNEEPVWRPAPEPAPT